MTSPPISTAATSPSTNVTTPEESNHQLHHQNNDHDDIWGSDSDDQDHNHSTALTDQATRQTSILSDLPTLRRQHMTTGYREGLSIGKAKVMQQGFDQGYPIGIAIALRAGKILGVLEGWLASMSATSKASVRSSDDVKADEEKRARKDELTKIYERAKAELAIAKLLGGLNDEDVAAAEGIPDSVEVVLRRWEAAVLGGMRSTGDRVVAAR